MAASDELPRGLPMSVEFTGPATPVVTYPACPGISWVLTDINVTGSSAQVAAGYGPVLITTNVFPIASTGVGSMDEAGAGPPATYGTMLFTWSGKIIQAVNTALVVEVNGALSASMFVVLETMAYPL